MPSRRTRIAAFAVAWLALARAGVASDAAPALTTAAAIHALSAAQAAAARPVRVRAVVTYVNEDGFYLFLQDASDGIFVDASDAPSPPAHPGDLALVEGVTAPGLFAPQIRLRRLTVVGNGRRCRPRARAPTPSHRVGQASTAGSFTLRGARCAPPASSRPCADRQYRPRREPGRGRRHVRRCACTSRTRTGMRTEGLIDTTPSCCAGVCGGIFNGQRQLIGVVLHAPDASAVTVTQAAPAPDPFAQGPLAIQSLFQFSPKAHESHRVRVDGTVIYRQPGGALYVWDGTAGLLVQTTCSLPTRSSWATRSSRSSGSRSWATRTPVLADATLQARARRRAALPSRRPPSASGGQQVATTRASCHRSRRRCSTSSTTGARSPLALMAENVVFNAEAVPALRTEAATSSSSAPQPAAPHGHQRRARRQRAGRATIGSRCSCARRATCRSSRGPSSSWWTPRAAAQYGLVARRRCWRSSWRGSSCCVRAACASRPRSFRAQIQREATLEDRYRDPLRERERRRLLAGSAARRLSRPSTAPPRRSPATGAPSCRRAQPSSTSSAKA